MVDKYILKNKIAVATNNLVEWGQQFETSDRIVNRTVMGSVEVSTVFLGIDHNFGGKGPPLLFETMVFGGSQDGDCARCSTWEQAEKQHDRVVKEVGESNETTHSS